MLIRVENSRPLTYDTPDEHRLITPACFLEDVQDIEDLDQIDGAASTGRRKYLQELRSKLRMRFQK